MPSTLYKIWQVGGPVGLGVMQSLHVGVAGVAKSADATNPYAVANELICGYLARAILLPTPPGFLIDHNGCPHHVSLNFNLAGQQLPPANAANIVLNHPELSWGIVLFDTWICNPDRHNQNISYDATSNKIQVFDHSHAFCNQIDIQASLQAKEFELFIGGHCLAPMINSSSGFAKWLHRIVSVPDYYIQEVVESAVAIGLPQSDVSFCQNFLIQRRNGLKSLISSRRTHFPMLPSTVTL